MGGKNSREFDIRVRSGKGREEKKIRYLLILGYGVTARDFGDIVRESDGVFEISRFNYNRVYYPHAYKAIGFASGTTFAAVKVVLQGTSRMSKIFAMVGISQISRG